MLYIGKKTKGRLGFTLAEVLVTLMIIGVVGALTIPAFIANHQKKVYVESLKKFVATFQGGIQKYSAEKGCIGDLSCTGIFKYATHNGNSKPLLDGMAKSTFNVIKSCSGSDMTCVKGPYVYSTSATGVQTTVANPGWHGDARAYSYKTADGMLVWIYFVDSIAINCTNTGNSASQATPMCAGVAVDINGDKPPNANGRDYFVFYLANKGYLYPRGGMEMAKYTCGENWTTCANYWPVSSYATCNNNRPYGACAARIMEQGWEMTY